MALLLKYGKDSGLLRFVARRLVNSNGIDVTDGVYVTQFLQRISFPALSTPYDFVGDWSLGLSLEALASDSFSKYQCRREGTLFLGYPSDPIPFRSNGLASYRNANSCATVLWHKKALAHLKAGKYTSVVIKTSLHMTTSMFEDFSTLGFKCREAQSFNPGTDPVYVIAFGKSGRAVNLQEILRGYLVYWHEQAIAKSSIQTANSYTASQYYKHVHRTFGLDFDTETDKVRCIVTGDSLSPLLRKLLQWTVPGKVEAPKSVLSGEAPIVSTPVGESVPLTSAEVDNPPPLEEVEAVVDVKENDDAGVGSDDELLRTVVGFRALDPASNVYDEAASQVPPLLLIKEAPPEGAQDFC